MTDSSERDSGQHNHGGQQGSTKHGGNDPETEVGKNATETSKASGAPEQRHGKDIKETAQQRKGGDADNPSETTGATESGGEDKGAKD